MKSGRCGLGEQESSRLNIWYPIDKLVELFLNYDLIGFVDLACILRDLATKKK